MNRKYAVVLKLLNDDIVANECLAQYRVSKGVSKMVGIFSYMENAMELVEQIVFSIMIIKNGIDFMKDKNQTTINMISYEFNRNSTEKDAPKFYQRYNFIKDLDRDHSSNSSEWKSIKDNSYFVSRNKNELFKFIVHYKYKLPGIMYDGYDTKKIFSVEAVEIPCEFLGKEDTNIAEHNYIGDILSSIRNPKIELIVESIKKSNKFNIIKDSMVD